MIQVKEHYIIDDKGKTTNVILTKKDYDRLVDYIEDLEDLAVYDQSKAKGETTKPWKKVRR